MKKSKRTKVTQDLQKKRKKYILEDKKMKKSKESQDKMKTKILRITKIPEATKKIVNIETIEEVTTDPLIKLKEETLIDIDKKMNMTTDSLDTPGKMITETKGTTTTTRRIKDNKEDRKFKVDEDKTMKIIEAATDHIIATMAGKTIATDSLGKTKGQRIENQSSSPNIAQKWRSPISIAVEKPRLEE